MPTASGGTSSHCWKRPPTPELAREALAARHREGAVSLAYYAMLYAARATLSEEDANARSHRGIWNLFRIDYVVTDAFDANLFTPWRRCWAPTDGSGLNWPTFAAENFQCAHHM